MKVQIPRIAIIGMAVLCRISGPAAVPAWAQDGAALFKTWCSTCHEADPESRAPSREILQRMNPEQILQALEKGAMVVQGADRSRAERRVLAEYLSGKRFGSEPISAIPGVVFSGSNDGHLRAYSTADGRIVWDYDTAHEFTTVNGVKANGGSINNGGPAAAGGTLFTNSGYSHHSGILPGNVLLAFTVE